MFKQGQVFLWLLFMLIWFQASKADYNIFSYFFNQIQSYKISKYYFIFIYCIVFFEDVVFCCSLLLLVSKGLVMHKHAKVRDTTELIVIFPLSSLF